MEWTADFLQEHATILARVVDRPLVFRRLAALTDAQLNAVLAFTLQWNVPRALATEGPKHPIREERM